MQNGKFSPYWYLNWIYTQAIFVFKGYMSRVALLEQINVLRHQVFVVLNSHKSSLFLSDLFCLYWCAVSISIWCQARAVSFGLTNYEECLHRSEWVSEWVIHLHIRVPTTNSFQRFASWRVYKRMSLAFKRFSCSWKRTRNGHAWSGKRIIHVGICDVTVRELTFTAI